MEYIKENLDSVAFGKNILKIENIDISVNFNDFEDRYIKEYSPLYVYARIPIEDLQKIHYLENCGFNYVETQFKMKKRLSKLEDMSIFNDEYLYTPVTNVNEIPYICEISDKIMNVDRMILDEKLEKKSAQKRYHLYIKKSFENKEEHLYKFIYKPTNEVIGYHTEKLIDDNNILFYIGGIVPEYQKTGATFALEYSVFNNLYLSGFKKIITHISAANYNIINFEMRTVGFKPIQTYVILRKVY